MGGKISHCYTSENHDLQLIVDLQLAIGHGSH